jgi:tRNA(fMet)-specific endonuclease VapC
VFLLDTDHVVILQANVPELADRITAKMTPYASSDFLISFVSFHEQVAGWQAYLNRRSDAAAVVCAYLLFSRLLADYSRARRAPFSEAAGEQFESLRKQGVRIGTRDLRIAWIALVGDYTLIRGI